MIIGSSIPSSVGFDVLVNTGGSSLSSEFTGGVEEVVLALLALL